mgnify:FL=1
MEDFREMLLQEQKRLEEIVRKASEQLKDVPQGALRLSCSAKGVQYYYQGPGKKKNGEYIRKSDQTLIHRLAQKSYDEKVLRLAAKRLAQIKKITKDYDEEEIEKVFLREHAERRKLIVPVEATWEQQLELWISKEYKSKEFQENTPVILTEKGERVRSKSEKILADYFYRQGIPYKYECALNLKHYGTVYPDFTFFSKRTRQEIYWEHHGMMDDPAYAQNAVKKIQAYEKNGIYPGERLILTFETNQVALSSQMIGNYVRRYLQS